MSGIHTVCALCLHPREAGNICDKCHAPASTAVAAALPAVQPCEMVTIQKPSTSDPVRHPAHYTAHPSGVEAITIAEHFGFNLGNAIKYIWRAGIKSEDPREDLLKAKWYVERELKRLEKAADWRQTDRA